MRTQNGKTPSEGLAAVSDTGLEIDGFHGDHILIDGPNQSAIILTLAHRIFFNGLEHPSIVISDCPPYSIEDAMVAMSDFRECYSGLLTEHYLKDRYDYVTHEIIHSELQNKIRALITMKGCFPGGLT